MCDLCTAAARLVVTAQTELLIATQQDTGQAPSNAARPLFDHEEAAQVRFADIESDLDHATGWAADAITQTDQQLRESLLDQLFGTAQTVATSDALAVLAAVGLVAPKTVAKALLDLQGVLESVFQSSHTAAVDTVRAEAARQGIKTHPVPPKALPSAVAQSLASSTTNRLWSWLTHKTNDLLTQPGMLTEPAITRAAVVEALEKIEPKAAIDNARQGVHIASGTGRTTTAELYEPDEIWASEIMDGSTCPECAKTDGKQYQDMEAALADYPEGYNKRCHGGARCRGTLVFIFEDPEDT